MPGTIILKPLKANLLKDNHQFLKMDPYCCLTLGSQEVHGKVCKNGGKSPSWDESLIVRRAYEPYLTLQLKDHEFFKNDATLGMAEIDLREIESSGRVTKWYKLVNNNAEAGEILIESVFAPDSSGSYKQLPQQQSYAQPPSYKGYAQNIYPASIYSPDKKYSMGLDRPVSPKIEGPEIYGYHNKDQLVTYPHISHNMTAEEYSKCHSRNPSRFQPTNRVVPLQKAPPTWEGYQVPEHLLPQEPSKEVEMEKPEVSEVLKNVTITPEEVGAKSLESMETASSDKNITNIKNVSAGNVVPVSQRMEAREEVNKAPGCLTYYPMIGGVTYKPYGNEATYKPVYEWPSRAYVSGTSESQEYAKNARKLSGGSLSTDEKSASTMGSLGNVGTSSVTAI